MPVGRIDVINEEADPGAEAPPSGSSPAGAIGSDRAGADNQFDVADDTVLVVPSLPLDEAKDLDQRPGRPPESRQRRSDEGDLPS